MNILKKSLLYTLLSLVVFGSFPTFAMDQNPEKNKIAKNEKSTYATNWLGAGIIATAIILGGYLFYKKNLNPKIKKKKLFHDKKTNKTLPLHYAVKNENIESLKKHLERPINVNIKNKHGKTPIFHVVYSKNEKFIVESIKLLIENKANPDIEYSTKTNAFSRNILYDAIHKPSAPNLMVITTLLQHGINPTVNVTNIGFNNIFHYVALYIPSKNLIEVGQKLIESLHNNKKIAFLLLLIRNACKKNNHYFGLIPKTVLLNCIYQPYLSNSDYLIPVLEQKNDKKQTPSEILLQRLSNDQKNQEIYLKAADIFNPDKYR